MLATLLQQFTDDSINTGAQAGAAVGAVVALALYAVVIFVIVGGMWKVFTKAGEPGWHAIVPILNTYTLIKVARRPGWWLLLMFIPCINFVVAIIVMLDLAKAFNKGTGFGIGLIILSPVFIPILGFGSATYDPGVPSYGYGGGAYGGGYVPPAGTGATWGGTGAASGGFNPTAGPAGAQQSSTGLPGMGSAWAEPSTPSEPSAQQQVPAGWYPDPSGAGQRWWDGTAWTDHRSD